MGRGHVNKRVIVYNACRSPQSFNPFFFLGSGRCAVEVKKTPAGEPAGHADAIHTSTVNGTPKASSRLFALGTCGQSRNRRNEI